MKQVFLKRKEVIIEDIPLPICNEYEILVANAYSAISVGTERSVITKGKGPSIMGVLKSTALMKKALGYVKKKGVRGAVSAVRELGEAFGPLGYSSAGVVMAVGKNVADINVGDRVACAGGGKANHAEVVAVPRNLVAKIPEGVSFEEGSFTTLGAIAMHGIRRAGRQFGETIAILGVGLLGQLAVQIAKAAGYKVIAIDKDSERIELAKKMGADLGLIVGKDDIEKRALYDTNGIGADAVVIYAATPGSEPTNLAMRLARKKGRIVVVGDVGMNLERSVLYEKELDFLMSTSYGPGRYDPLYEEKGIDYPIKYVRWTENRNMQAFLDLLKNMKVNVKPLISAIFPVEKAKEAYELIVKDVKKPLGVVLKYDPNQHVTSTGKIIPFKRTVEISSRIIEGKINVALVGAGRFAKATFLPLMSRIPDYNLRAVCSTKGINSKEVALKYNAQYYSTDYNEVLEDENIDLVIIATPHNLHYPMIVDAAKAGKAVYVEKPMCLSEEELDDIVKVIARTKVPLVVGFNRRYAPLAIRMRELLKQKQRPYLINYRVNAGYVPKTHWVQDPQVGGGRIVGECCHFFDFFNYIVESEVESICALGIPVDDTTVVANDNVVGTIKWADGSLTTLTYTALGHGDLPKERIEIYADKSSIVIDDFKNMELYGFKGKSIRMKRQDKGHHQELIELGKFLKNEESNIVSFQECVKAMKIAFEAEKLMKKWTNKIY